MAQNANACHFLFLGTWNLPSHLRIRRRTADEPDEYGDASGVARLVVLHEAITLSSAVESRDEKNILKIIFF